MITDEENSVSISFMDWKDEIIFDNGCCKSAGFMINVATNDSFDKIGHYLNVKLRVWKTT